MTNAKGLCESFTRTMMPVTIGECFPIVIAGPGMIPPAQVLSNPTVAQIVPMMGEVGGNGAFFRPLLGYVMYDNEHDILTKF